MVDCWEPMFNWRTCKCIQSLAISKAFFSLNLKAVVTSFHYMYFVIYEKMFCNLREDVL